MCKIINFEDGEEYTPPPEKPEIFKKLNLKEIRDGIKGTKILDSKISLFIKKLIEDEGFNHSLVYAQMVKTTEEVSFSLSNTDNHDEFLQAAHDVITATGTRLGGSGKLCKHRLAEREESGRKLLREEQDRADNLKKSGNTANDTE